MSARAAEPEAAPDGADTFPRFAELPAHIRRKIWEQSLTTEEPRMHTLGVLLNWDVSAGARAPRRAFIGFTIRGTRSTLWESTVTTRSVLSTSVEARRVGLAVVPHALQFEHSHSKSCGTLHFDGDRDVLLLSVRGHLLNVRPGRALGFDAIRHVALDAATVNGMHISMLENFPGLRALSLVVSGPCKSHYNRDNCVDKCIDATGPRFVSSEVVPESHVYYSRQVDGNTGCWSENRDEVRKLEWHVEWKPRCVMMRADIRTLVQKPRW